jgi:hypothetical protein
VRESRDRVRAAIRNAGLEFPIERIKVNLAPADLRKEGAAFDLPTAVGILCATGLIKPGRLERALARSPLTSRCCPPRYFTRRSASSDLTAPWPQPVSSSPFRRISPRKDVFVGVTPLKVNTSPSGDT